MTLSPASVRNVMSDLESLGLIYAPHTSAGRLPTQTGLRLFVDGLLEIGDISEEERGQIESHMAGSGRRRAAEDFLAEAGEMLSGLSRCAGVVLVDKQSKRLKQVEFVNLGEGKALAVLVSEDGDVENRIISLPRDCRCPRCNEASNYINARIGGLTLAEARDRIETEIEQRRAQLDELTARIVTDGLATWSGSSDEPQEPHRVRPRASAGGREGDGGPRAGAAPVRGSGRQEGPDPAARARRAGGRRTHLHRLGEQAVLAVGLGADRLALRGHRAEDRWRAWGDRPDAAELCAHHPHG